MSSFTKTFRVEIEIETLVVRSERYPGVVFVYARQNKPEGSGKVTRVIMLKKEFDKIRSVTSTGKFKGMKVFLPHLARHQATDPTWAEGLVTAMSAEAMTAYLNREGKEQFPDFEWPIVWGEDLPENMNLVVWSYADNMLCDFSGKPLNRPVADFYTASSYDIRKIVDDVKSNLIKDISVRPERFYSRPGEDPIYYVRGNGYTVNLTIRIPDELWPAYVEARTLGIWQGQVFLDQNTSLGKYKQQSMASDIEEGEE